MRAGQGVKIVLTASPAEMSQYNNDAFVAFVCTFPYRITRPFMEHHLKPVNNMDGTAKFAPYGLRKIEALLIDAFGEENVAVVHYENLDQFIGPKTKIVGITAMDPMGIAYVSTTYNSIVGFGGQALNAYEFERLVRHPSIQKYRPTVVLGGAGGWQVRETRMQEAYGIDTIIAGECEEEIVPLFTRILNGEKVEKYVRTKRPNYINVPVIRHAACYGAVEITRGCGRGCEFCSPTMRTKYSFPLEHIMKDVEVNVRCGQNMAFIVSEDIFLYKSFPGFKPNREEILKLYKAIASYPGIEFINFSHASLAPILYDRKILPELTPILIEKTQRRLNGRRYIPIEVGIETGSTRLMQKHMRGKALPFSVENWPQLVCEGIAEMNDHDWIPLCTIMAGLPDETEDDVIATLNLVDDLHAQGCKLFYTPVLFIPLDEAILSNARRASLDRLTERHWEFIATCWKYNVQLWAQDKMWTIRFVSFALYWCYIRWIHGPKATRPVLKFLGFPVNIPRKVGKKCEPEYCYQATPAISQENSICTKR